MLGTPHMVHRMCVQRRQGRLQQQLLGRDAGWGLARLWGLCPALVTAVPCQRWAQPLQQQVLILWGGIC